MEIEKPLAEQQRAGHPDARHRRVLPGWLDDVLAARVAQDAEHGGQSPARWLVVIADYLKAASYFSAGPLTVDREEAYRTCLVKIAALSVIGIESIDRRAARREAKRDR
jgi:hypothetical protein